MTRTYFIPAIISLLLVACGQRENKEQLLAINRSFEYSNAIIQDANKWVYEELAEKIKDPSTHFKGEVWQPKANRIQHCADNIKVMIENMKSELIKQTDSFKEKNAPVLKQLNASDGQGYLLVNKLAAFKDSICTIIGDKEFIDNPVYRTHIRNDYYKLSKTIPLLTGYADSLSADQRIVYLKKWLQENLAGNSAVMTMVALNKIKNDVLGTEKVLIDYCNNQATVIRCLQFEVFHVITALSSSYVKKGQSIEVTAGVGRFSAASKPMIVINGEEIQVNSDATANYHFTATGSPGKHTIPVKIKFAKPDGSMEEVRKKLEYIIAEEK